MVDFLEVHRGLLAGAEYVELGSTIPHSLLALGLRAGEDNDVTTYLTGKFDSQVAETTNTHNGDTIGRANTIFGQDSPDSSTSTHERGSISRGKLIGDRVDTSGIPNRTVAEGVSWKSYCFWLRQY